MQIVLRITNNNCYAACSAARGSKNRSRYAWCGFLSPTFQPTKKPSVFSYKVGWNVSYLERYVQYILKKNELTKIMHNNIINVWKMDIYFMVANI